MQNNNLTESLELKEIAVKAAVAELRAWIKTCKKLIKIVIKLGYEKETTFVKLIDCWNLRINIYSTELSSRGARRVKWIKKQHNKELVL